MKYFYEEGCGDWKSLPYGQTCLSSMLDIHKNVAKKKAEEIQQLENKKEAN